MSMRIRWKDVLAGYPDKDLLFDADAKDGWFVIKVNENVIFEGSQSDAFVTFIALSKLFGPRISKDLMKLKGPNEKVIRDA